MRTSRAPWWLYIIAASFLGFFALQVYVYIWGPEPIRFQADYSSGSMIALEVSPDGAGARGGLRTGDRIVAANNIPIRGENGDFGWYLVGANFEPGRSIPMKIEREGKRIELSVTLRRKSLRDLGWFDWEVLGGGIFTFILGLVIAFRRPYDPIARIGAWLLASLVFAMVFTGYGWASAWRHLPAPLGLLLWPASISRGLIFGLGLTFVAIFPRKLLHARWVWVLIWTPVMLVAALQCLLYVRLVYQPEGTPTALDMINPVWDVLGLCYMPAFFVVWVVQYRRLEDVNERRRMRVWLAGALMCGLAVVMIITLDLVPAPVAAAISATPVPPLLFGLYLAFPLSFAYAVLRHRVFDLGVILRRGLQYALARRMLVSAVPVLAAIFLADLLLHGDQPILAVFRARGWMYAALAALAAIAYTQRQRWLEGLDRRFFREHYDARRLFCAGSWKKYMPHRVSSRKLRV